MFESPGENRVSHLTYSMYLGRRHVFNLPNEPTILYLYNPFQARLWDRVIANIEMSLRDHPRDLWVIYANPWRAVSSGGARCLKRLSGIQNILFIALPMAVCSGRRHNAINHACPIKETCAGPS